MAIKLKRSSKNDSAVDKDISSVKTAKRRRYLPKRIRILCFILACINICASLFAKGYVHVNQYIEDVDFSDTTYSVVTDNRYKKKITDTYEQLCILGVCSLADMNSEMEYQGNKYLMEDLLYYFDYNDYKYKRTDNGILPVSDDFDYYVSYTLTDDETTDEETEDREDNVRFITNISESVINHNMTEDERLDVLRNDFHNYLLRCKDTMTSDMLSSNITETYRYRDAECANTSNNEGLGSIEENYPNNYLPLGGWYYDSYGRYIYYFGNMDPIKFYKYPENSGQGVKARVEWQKDTDKKRRYDPFEFDREFADDYNNINYRSDMVYIESLDDYEAFQGSTKELTVFIAPKEDILKNYEDELFARMSLLYINNNIMRITGVLAVLLVLLLMYSSVMQGIEKTVDIEFFEQIPSDFLVFGILVSGFVIISSNTYELVASNVLILLTFISIFLFSVLNLIKRLLGKRFYSTGLMPVILKKYSTTELFRERRKINLGRRLRSRSILLLSLIALCALILFVFIFLGEDSLVLLVISLAAVCITGILGISVLILNIVNANQLIKLENRIAALNDHEDFKDDVSEFSPVYLDMENLSNISDSVDRAVEEQIKSERMKIELIANVSHDLKTPLTSIISYIDLLKKLELDDEASSYVKILDKKSQKLKDIVADVFSMAKATSGIDVDLTKLDMVMLFNQFYADAEDKLKNCGRTFKTDIVLPSATVMADGNKMYRVFQNLVDNAVKYSMDGSRIFMDITENDGYAVFTVKNISSYPIDFTADEITERFVRGDRSRTDGGSGLGLSIAKTFTEACGGKFEIVLDGDMFKAVVAMPIVNDDIVGDEIVQNDDPM